jgi:hypothetical protein
MTSGAETGNRTGTADKDYNLLWFTEQCHGGAPKQRSSRR